LKNRAKRFFYDISKKKLTIPSAALILAATYLVSNLLGVLRQRLIATRFGADVLTDIYFASFRIPDLIFNLLVLGAISSAFIPVYIDHMKKKEDSDYVASNFMNFLILGTLVFGVIVFVMSRKLVPLLLPGLFTHETPDFNTLEVAVNSIRIMLISPLFFAVSSVLGGILNSHKRFLSYALAPVFYNLGIIFGIFFFAPLTSIPIYGLLYGVLLGALLHALVQVPAAISSGFRWKPVLNLRKFELPHIFKLMIPRTLAIGVHQINILIDTLVASFFVGGITFLTFANDIQTLPTVVFGVSIATAVFPFMAEKYSKKETKELVRIFSESARKILYFMIPATVGIIILRAQIVRLIFGAGEFDWTATYWTTKSLGFFAVGLFAQGLIPLCLRAFYAMKDTKTPLLIGLTTMIINLLFTVSLPFIKVLELEVAGIALAYSIAGIANVSLLLYALNKKIGALDKDNRIFASTSRLVTASVIMGVLAHYSLYVSDAFLNTGTVVGLFLQASIAVATGAAVYFGLTHFWECEEAGLVFKKSV
jgi:putative peptidoglycan lipid II flippase